MGSEFKRFAENFASMVVDGFAQGHPDVKQDEPEVHDDGCFITLREESVSIPEFAGDVFKEIWNVDIFLRPVVGKGRVELTINLKGTPVSRRFEIAYDQRLKPSDYVVQRVWGVVDRMFTLAYDMTAKFDSWSGVNVGDDDTTDEL